MKVFIVSTVLILAAFIFPGPVHAQMRHVGGNYYRDSSHIYVKVRVPNDSLYSLLQPEAYTFDVVIGADPRTFVVLGDGYAKDRNYVYNEQRLDKLSCRLTLD